MRFWLAWVVLCFGMGWLAPLAAGDEFGGAAWLRDPRFEGLAPATLHAREREKRPQPGGPRNVHTLFRKEFTLREAPARALLTVTADDYCRLYVNGAFTVQGPEPGYHFAYPYYWLDVTDFTQAGANVLAAHVYYQGLVNRVWNSGDNRAGFMLRLEATYADGTRDVIETDETWRCHALAAFPGARTTGYDTQFLEDIDLRAWPAGWADAGFDDSGWAAPLMGRQDHTFVRASTPPLQVSRWFPGAAVRVGEGRYRYDFGMTIVGHTRIRVSGPAGHRMTVRHGEELNPDGSVRHEMRAKCVYEEFPVLSGGDDLVAFYDYRSFRHLEILDAPSEPEVWVDVRHYPFDPDAARFESPHRLLQDTWTICRNAVWMGTQGGFLDCPSREKGQYLGDAIIAARAHLWLTGDTRITRKAVVDFAHSAHISPSLLSIAPGNVMQEIAEYSLQYPLLVEAYHRHSGDDTLARWVAERVYPALFDYFAGFQDERGLIVGLDKPEKWVLVDWPENLRDDYDYKASLKRGNTVLNAFHHGALLSAARLCAAVGLDGAPYAARAARAAAGIAAHCTDPETGLYRDAPESPRHSLHANAIPMRFGLVEGVDEDRVFAHIAEKGLACGVYIASYVIEACFERGRADLGYALLTNESERSWAEMLRHGATTCMEVWGPDQKWNTSWLHPWAASPIYLVAERLLGLSPASPGWAGLRVVPAPVADLPAMALTVPAPFGSIRAEHRPGQGYRVAVPLGVPVGVEAPEGMKVDVLHTADDRPAPLPPEDAAYLESHGWGARVGDGLGVWICVDDQMMRLVSRGTVLWRARVGTAANGTGFVSGSLQTPLGWHKVNGKFGDTAPWGQVFRSRAPSREIWKPGDDVEEDLVLTRVLWLDGLEPGRNKGKDAAGRLVDSRERCIYIHGTNGEAIIGTPSSHGCIRMLNDDVIAAYARIPDGTPVLITERRPAEPGA